MNIVYYRHNNKGICTEIFPEHFQYHDLTFVLSGEMEYAVDGKTYLLHTGDVIYIPVGQTRARKATLGVDYVSFNFSVEEKLPFPTLLKGCVEEVSLTLIHAFDGIFARTFNLSDTRFTCIFECLIKQLAVEFSVKEENPVSNKIKQYVKYHLSEKITLEDIAKDVFLSPNYCDHIFKKETGRSIVDYILEKRVEYAKNLLWDHSIKLVQVAKTVGYTDYGYFCRIFKKRTGYSPLQYRKQTIGQSL